MKAWIVWIVWHEPDTDDRCITGIFASRDLAVEHVDDGGSIECVEVHETEESYHQEMLDIVRERLIGRLSNLEKEALGLPFNPDDESDDDEIEEIG